MKSKWSKMLHPLCGKPLIEHISRIASELQPASTTVVIGYQRDQVRHVLAGNSVRFVEQQEQLGTAHAVSEYLKNQPELDGVLLVMNGDTPLLRAETLRELLSLHSEKRAAISLLTTEMNNPRGYGRVIRNQTGALARIVEEADANSEERTVREINAGVYLFEIQKLRELLPRVQRTNRQKEYYLPDVIELALRANLLVLPHSAAAQEVAGINTRAELAAAEKILRERINEQWMLRGVTMHDPSTVYIDVDVDLGTDVVLYPNVYLEGSTKIDSEVIIHPNCRISNSTIGKGCMIFENSSIDGAHVEEEVRIGPFARIRPESHLSKSVHIGNFVELKKTRIGEGSKANHLSYLGDASIGKRVNVGAGTITCNYDGEKKHPTEIGDEVFIGSDSQLVAPVKVGDSAYIAAGSSITEDVPAGSLAIARSRQVNKPGWVAKRKMNRKDHKDREEKK